MVIFGWREAKINIQPVNNHSCSSCNTQERLFIQVNSLYTHVFWIPVIPLYKKTFSICGHCKQVMNKSQMPPDLQKKAKDYRKTSKTPWWMFSGILIVTLLMLYQFSLALFNS